MSRVFLRYFLSIFALAVVILLIQFGVLAFQYRTSQEKWVDQIYDDFVVSVEDAIKEGDFADYAFKTIVYSVSQINDDRISGFVLRDASNSMVLSFGREGTNVPQSRWDVATGSGDEAQGRVVKNGTRINILMDGPSVKGIERSDASITIPSNLRMKTAGVIGSILVSLDGKDAFYIDLLTFNPRTYQYSKDIINSCLSGMMVSIPVCLVIALVAAWIISSRNAAYINQVRKALKDLSRGKPNVNIPRQGNADLDEITVAIEDLDKNLQSNAKSRKAWLQSISHDLNTPTAAMKMIIDGLSDGVFPADDETFHELKKENDILSERIGRVIDFSTLQADAKPEISNVSSMLFMDGVRSTVPNPERIQATASCPSIRCDANLMLRAVAELLNNALESGSESDEPVRLTVSETDVSYQISVVNHGRIPTDMDTDFFEPWTRGDWSRTSGGSGLGLPIVATIAFLHKGDVSVKQTDADHVTATVTWPRSL